MKFMVEVTDFISPNDFKYRIESDCTREKDGIQKYLFSLMMKDCLDFAFHESMKLGRKDEGKRSMEMEPDNTELLASLSNGDDALARLLSMMEKGEA